MISPLLFSGADEFKRWPYDVAAAKQLMAEAGYPEGFELVMDCPNDRYVNDEEICQAVAAMLARIGVQGDPERAAQGAVFREGGPARKYDSSFNLLGWTPGSLDSWNVLANTRHLPRRERQGRHLQLRRLLQSEDRRACPAESWSSPTRPSATT